MNYEYESLNPSKSIIIDNSYHNQYRSLGKYKIYELSNP